MYSILNHPEPSRSHVGRDVFRTCSSLVSTDPPYELHSRDGSRPPQLLDRVLAQPHFEWHDAVVRLANAAVPRHGMLGFSLKVRQVRIWATGECSRPLPGSTSDERHARALGVSEAAAQRINP
jgi:hypothetical protein